MNSVLASFIKTQVDSLPSIKMDFSHLFVDARLKELNIRNYFDESQMKINMGYFDSKDHLEDCIKEPFWFLRLGLFRGNKKDVWAALKQNHLSLAAIDPKYQTKAMVEYCLNKTPELIAYSNIEVIDHDLSKTILEKQPLLFQFLPDKLKNYKNSMLAFDLDITVVSQLPLELIDSGVKSRLLETDKFILDSIPYAVLDIDILTNQVRIDPIQATKVCLELCSTHVDYDLFCLFADNINISEENTEAFSRIANKALFHNETMIAILQRYFRDRPESILFFKLDHLNVATLKDLVELQFDIKIPSVYWNELYKVVYNTNSPLAFQLTHDHADLLESHQAKWVKLWISLYGDLEEKPYLHPVFLNEELMNDEDIWGKIYESRLIYKLKQNFELDDFEKLKSVSIDNTHPLEIERLKDALTNELKDQLIEHDALWWFALNPEDINEENSMIFIKQYPQYSSRVPSFIKTDKFKQAAIAADPYIAEFI